MLFVIFSVLALKPAGSKTNILTVFFYSKLLPKLLPPPPPVYD
jgi:hypothetical protein